MIPCKFSNFLMPFSVPCNLSSNIVHCFFAFVPFNWTLESRCKSVKEIEMEEVEIPDMNERE